MSDKKNMILFVADQMRSDVMAHMGNPAAITPNLDSLAQEGVSFENAYCQNPVCVPSRNSFLTGLYPHVSGHRTMHYLQREDEPNILKEMKENGYELDITDERYHHEIYLSDPRKCDDNKLKTVIILVMK